MSLPKTTHIALQNKHLLKLWAIIAFEPAPQDGDELVMTQELIANMLGVAARA